MNEEECKKIVTRFIEEMWNQRKLQVADELFAADCVTHQLRSGENAAGVPRSAESVKQEAAAWLTGFPDLEFVLEQMIVAGDRVVSHCTNARHAFGCVDGNRTDWAEGECPDNYDLSHCGRKDR
jgi:predicted ester cyclase